MSAWEWTVLAAAGHGRTGNLLMSALMGLYACGFLTVGVLTWRHRRSAARESACAAPVAAALAPSVPESVGKVA